MTQAMGRWLGKARESMRPEEVKLAVLPNPDRGLFAMPFYRFWFWVVGLGLAYFVGKIFGSVVGGA